MAGRLAIFGTGGFGREILTTIRSRDGSNVSDVVFVADQPKDPVLGIEVIEPRALGATDELIIALGSSGDRQRIADRLAGIRGGQVIAPTAVIGPDIEIGEGAVFCDFSMVTASARIGRHFQCNIYSYVAHDCVIGDFVTFAPRVCCNGNVHIENGAYVGTGALIRNGAKDAPLVIGAGATIGMGAVVTKSVPPGVTVIGNPARVLGAN